MSGGTRVAIVGACTDVCSALRTAGSHVLGGQLAAALNGELEGELRTLPGINVPVGQRLDIAQVLLLTCRDPG